MSNHVTDLTTHGLHSNQGSQSKAWNWCKADFKARPIALSSIEIQSSCVGAWVVEPQSLCRWQTHRSPLKKIQGSGSEFQKQYTILIDTVLTVIQAPEKIDA